MVKKVEDVGKTEENQKVVEVAIMENDVSVLESYKNKSGDLTVVCETEVCRNQLKDLVATKSEDIVINTPRETRHSVSIVGLPKEYDKDEVTDMLVKQNGYIRSFASRSH